MPAAEPESEAGSGGRRPRRVPVGTSRGRQQTSGRLPSNTQNRVPVGTSRGRQQTSGRLPSNEPPVRRVPVGTSRGAQTFTGRLPTERTETSASAIRQGTVPDYYYAARPTPTYYTGQVTWVQTAGVRQAGVVPAPSYGAAQAGRDTFLAQWWDNFYRLMTRSNREGFLDVARFVVRSGGGYETVVRTTDVFTGEPIVARREEILDAQPEPRSVQEVRSASLAFERNRPIGTSGRPQRDDPRKTTPGRKTRVGRPGTPAGDAAIYRLARQAGLNREEAIRATAIALAESGGNPRALNPRGEYSMGLWQINMRDAFLSERLPLFDISSREELYNPATNASAMATLMRQRGWGEWTTFTRGTYKEFLGRAQRAAGVSGPVDLETPPGRPEPRQEPPSRERPPSTPAERQREQRAPKAPTESKAQPPLTDQPDSQVANPRSNDATGAPGSGGTGGGGGGGGPVEYENPLAPVTGGSRGPAEDSDTGVGETVDDTVSPDSAARGGVIRDASGNVITDTRLGPVDAGIFAGRGRTVWIVVGVLVIAAFVFWPKIKNAGGGELKAKAATAFDRFVDTSGRVVQSTGKAAT